MAKKGQAIQLQSEINTDEDWEKLLEKDGLIVVDVYSDWCGPCMGMAANLKKLKLEIGGDMLQLATVILLNQIESVTYHHMGRLKTFAVVPKAKSDGIASLERFRNKSEPTWMFIAKGKMVNLMFGADAPKLTRLIIDELRKETAAQEGQRERVALEVTDLAEEERVRYEEAETIARAAREKEEAKRAKELHNRRTAECQNILENLNQFGVVLIFPHAKDTYKEVLNDLIDEAGLTVQQIEKVNVTEAMLEELLYFAGEDKFPEELIDELLNDQSLVLSLKPKARGETIDNIDDFIISILYGESKIPPGSLNSPSRLLYDMKNENDEKIEVIGVWAPTNDCVKAAALKLFFPKLSVNFIIPEPEPEPPYLALVFDSRNKDEAINVMEQYPKEIMHYGFFTSEIPEESQLVAKNIKKLDKLGLARTFTEKLVMQVAKRKSECVFALAQLKPVYMSPNTKEGKRECELFFPEDYDETESEEEEVKEVITKKKVQRVSVEPHRIESEMETVEALEETVGSEDVDVIEEAEGENESAEINDATDTEATTEHVEDLPNPEPETADEVFEEVPIAEPITPTTEDVPEST